MKCPCTKTCPDRSETCHGTCTKYLIWKEEREKEAKWLRDQRPVLSDTGVRAYNRKIVRRARGWDRKSKGT